MQGETKDRLNVVPRVGEWYLTHFDYDKDLSVKDLVGKYPRVVSWASKGVLKIDYLGTIFQVYFKDMPYVGECLRFEGHYNAKVNVNLEDTVAHIVNGDKHPFTKIDEMLLSGREIDDDKNQ